jgi:hypothetical protein
MRFLRRSRSRRNAAADDDLRRSIASVSVVVEDDEPPALAPTLNPDPDARAQLRRIVAEAVILQDRAAEVLGDIRAREPLGAVAPRGGPLATRFFELRRRLPAPADGAMARQCETAGVVLDHHGMLITNALELLSVEWRSPVIARQLDLLDGLGPAAERLDDLYAELARSA